jgi:sugar lactone lactonase YvrE
VAGTTTQFDADGTYGADTYFDYTGTFSGYDGTKYVSGAYTIRSVVGASSLFPLPSWQSAALAAARLNDPQDWQSPATKRQVPDVATFALGQVNGTTAYPLVYDDNGQDAVFGTSVSAPIFSAVVCLVNQERARLGKPPIAGLNAALYQAFTLNMLNLPPPLSLPNKYNPHPVTGNRPAPDPYAYITGLGRPDVNELVLCLGDEFYAYCSQWTAGVIPGGTTTLAAQTVGGDATYQWQVNAGSGWTNLSDGENPTLFSGYAGAKTASLTVVARAGYPGTYRYRALVTAASGATAPTGPVSVAVGARPTASIVETPVNEPLQLFGSIHLTATPNTYPSYQWELNGQPIPGARQSTYLGSVSMGSQGYYSVVVSDPSQPTVSTTVNFGYIGVALPDRIYHVTALAGGTAGFQDGTGSSAQFGNPVGVAFDRQGNVIVADAANNCVRRVTPAGATTTIAGSAAAGNADGVGPAAQFHGPSAVAVDANGTIYVADPGNYRIRKIAPDGTVTTLAGSTSGYVDDQGSAAMFNYPFSVALDSSGRLYVLDRSSVTRIRVVTADGKVSTLATLSDLGKGFTVDSSGNVYVTTNSAIYRVGTDGAVTTLISSRGNTVDLTEVDTFSALNEIAIDSTGRLYFCDTSWVRQLPPGGSPANIFTDKGGTLFGTGGIGSSPLGIAADATGDLCYSWGSFGFSATNAVYVAKLVAAVTKPAPSGAVAAGDSVAMAVNVASDAGPSTYQWQHNGVNIAGATSATFTVNRAGPADRGDYSVVWTSPTGSSTLGAGTLSVTGSDAKIVDLSVRAAVGAHGDVLITGFTVAGDNGATPKPLLITGRGPFLEQFGISNFLAAPKTTLFDGQSQPIATGMAWSTPPQIASGTGSSPLAGVVPVAVASSSLLQAVTGGTMPSGSADAVAVATLPAGTYSNVISAADAGAGVALAEVFDADPWLGTGGTHSRLINVSARARVGSGNQVLIAGLVVAQGASGAPETVMIRAQGPNLANFGLNDVMSHTRITLFDAQSAPIASNTGWTNAPIYITSTSSSPLASSGVGLQSATTALQQQYAGNAFDQGASDSAMVVSLPAGQYSIVLDNPDGLSGVGLIEVYEVR